MLTGMVSTPAAVGSAAVLAGIQGQLAAMTAANAASSGATIPPGLDGASARAVAQQAASAATFQTNFLAGIEQMMELSGTVATASVTHEVADAGGANLITALI